MWGTCSRSSNPSWRQESKLPCYNTGAGGSPAALHAHGDRAGCPSPVQTGRSVALLPARGGFFGHFLMNLAEETCSKVITSALYLSSPGWKAIFLQVCGKKNMFSKYCHTVHKKCTFTWQRQGAVLLIALDTRNRNSSLLTDMNLPISFHWCAFFYGDFILPWVLFHFFSVFKIFNSLRHPSFFFPLHSSRHNRRCTLSWLSALLQRLKYPLIHQPLQN